jgi:ribosomal protein S18 acetylase RimI-like enzyme
MNFPAWRVKQLINIHDYTVSLSFRNRGSGYFVLNGTEQHTLQNGYCRINLEVRHDHLIAWNLYGKAGFDECPPPNLF